MRKLTFIKVQQVLQGDTARKSDRAISLNYCFALMSQPLSYFCRRVLMEHLCSLDYLKPASSWVHFPIKGRPGQTINSGVTSFSDSSHSLYIQQLHKPVPFSELQFSAEGCAGATWPELCGWLTEEPSCPSSLSSPLCAQGQPRWRQLAHKSKLGCVLHPTANKPFSALQTGTLIYVKGYQIPLLGLARCKYFG